MSILFDKTLARCHVHSFLVQIYIEFNLYTTFCIRDGPIWIQIYILLLHQKQVFDVWIAHYWFFKALYYKCFRTYWYVNNEYQGCFLECFWHHTILHRLHNALESEENKNWIKCFEILKLWRILIETIWFYLMPKGGILYKHSCPYYYSAVFFTNFRKLWALHSILVAAIISLLFSTIKDLLPLSFQFSSHFFFVFCYKIKCV